jgi:hypothetical protein
MAGQPEGSFLIRDSHEPGDFTLTVRWDYNVISTCQSSNYNFTTVLHFKIANLLLLLLLLLRILV